MDANTLTLIALGIILAGIVYNQFIKPFRRATSSPAGETSITEETIAQATPEAPIAMRAWLDYLNRQPDRVPHVAIVGPSGAGKTMLATAVLSDRPGQIVIITAKEGDNWGGLPYIGIDETGRYDTANETFIALDAEVKRRLVALKRQQLTADWLTVCLDDYSTLRAVCPTADGPFKLIARLGRSLRVRLIVLSDSALVKSWGIEGEGETRGNFAFVRLQRGHKGTIEIDGAELPIDTSLVHRIAQRASLADRAWRAPRDPDEELANLLHTSMAGAKPANHISMPYQYDGSMTDIDAVNRGMTSHTSMNGRDQAILAILSANPTASKNSIFAAVGGDRNAVMVRIDELKEFAQ